MSLYDEVQAAALEAQDVLVEMTNEGAFTITGDNTTYAGVFNEHDAVDPLSANAIEIVRFLVINANKEQFAAAPSAAPRKAITAKGRSWILTGVTDNPLSYVLTCRPTT